MRPSFYPRTVNGSFDDPGLFVPFVFEKRAVIFDMGDICSLSARDILKISHAFVSHTHMDHFIGFDQALRLFLGREKDFFIYGPEGFLKNVEGKLAGYSWNLVEQYENQFALYATEVSPPYLITRKYLCRKQFSPVQETRQFFNGILHREPGFTVSCIILDHRIPCLGFSIQEQFHINIVKEQVIALGLDIGPWLKRFKQALFDGKQSDSEIEATVGSRTKSFVLKDLANQIAIITPGQKITYIADTRYDAANASEIIAFARDSDHLFIEAAFLDEDNAIAQEKYHLTARNAGYIAGKARVRQFTLFHFSPRYTGMEHLLEAEAQAAFDMANGELRIEN